MAQSLLTAIGCVFLCAFAYICGAVFVRRFFSPRAAALYHGVGQLCVCMVLDLMVIYFSITFCTASIRQALRLRDGGTPNALLDDLMSLFGGASIDPATLWGVIIPFITWVVAHALVYAILEVSRYSYAAVHAQMARGAGDAAGPNVAPLLWLRTGGWIAAAGVVGVLFHEVVRFDSLLLRFQIVSSSKTLGKLLGKGWEARMSEDRLNAVLGNSFLGQIALHSGTFYVIMLIIAAFGMVISIHNLRRVLQPEPRPLELPPPPPPAPPTPVVGAANQRAGNGPDPAAAARGPGISPPAAPRQEAPPPESPGSGDLPPLGPPPSGGGTGQRVHLPPAE